MHLILVGVNHRTAPLAVRERLSFGKAGAGLAARRLADADGVQEAVVLSTCNRTEVYAACARLDSAPLVRLLVECGVAEKELRDCIFVHHGEEAARHLHLVAAGLDSMVLGEAQILGQVKDAIALATESRAAGPVLDRLFRSATTAGKRVRTETALTRGAVSISHAAVELARRIFGKLKGLDAIILGAGEMSKVTARLLADAGVASILVANRTYERAQALAEHLGGKAIRYDDLQKHLARADMVICSTAAPHPILRVDNMRPVVAARHGRPLFVIDIAVPRDVEPAVGDMKDVYLYAIDDLQGVVDENLAERRTEISAAEKIADEELAKFLGWLRSMDAGPLLAALTQKGEEVALGEIERTLGRLQHLSDRDRQLFETAMRGVARRLLREPILAVKRFAANGEPQHPLETVQQLFGLPSPDSLEALPGGEEAPTAERSSSGKTEALP